MARDPKIITFSSAAGPVNEVDSDRSSILPAPLRALRKEAVVFIKTRLTTLFDNADDSLFEMADRATSNTEQTLFFEAMRAVRLQRHAITSSCCQRLVREMEALNAASYPAERKPQTNFAVDSLSLVQPDELEQTVALDSMVGRVVVRNKQPLSHLAIRMNSLVKAPVDEQTNPLGPAVLAQIFVDALGEVTLDIKVRLIILKLFERYVFNPIDSLFEVANALLVNAGVLPDLKNTGVSRRQPTVGGSRDGSAPKPFDGSEDDDQQRVLSLFSELIGNWRHASGDAALSRVTSSPSVPLQSAELLGVLAQLPVDQFVESGFRRQDLRIHINQLIRGQSDQQGQQRSLDRIDEDVISLVSMLFDFILDDPQLPAALKAMIGRLQLPILRLAIADKRFFGQASHPARRLLNELARATMGWNDQDDLRRDQLHVLLESIVQRLLAEPDPQPELFAAMHGELTSFVNSEKRRSDRLEQRTRDAEEGKARIDAARSQVASRLNGMLLGKTLPVFVVDLLRDTWSQVMQMTCLREGSESAASLAVERTAQSLLDSVDPLGSGSATEREKHNLGVREAVADGLTLLGMQAEQGAPLLVRLKQLQQAMVMEAKPQSDDADPVTGSAVEHRDMTSTARAHPQVEGIQSATNTSAQTAATARSLSGSRGVAAGIAVREIVLHEIAAPECATAAIEGAASAPPAGDQLNVPRQRAAVTRMPVVEVREPVLQEIEASAAHVLTDEAGPHATAWVDQLHTGSWFELRADPEAVAQRCKLAAVISFSGKYIFVNRGGMKVAEFTSAELANHHARDLIRLLNDSQLFDRALESVIGNLRELQAGKNR